jgi:hypothetical protein
LSARMVENGINPPEMRVGNLLWNVVVNGVATKYTSEEYLITFGKGDNPITHTAKVIFEDNPEGKFHFSKLPPIDERNKKIRSNDVWECVNTRHIASTDAFGYLTDNEFKKTDASNVTKMSKGAGAVMLCQDKHIDSDVKDTLDWSTFHFVCDYLNRPKSSDEFCEDMLMMTLFHSCIMYVENNVSLVWQHFADRGFAGFLLYEIDLKTGLLKDKPGFRTTPESKQDLFDGVRNYIEYHTHKEKHQNILNEFSIIKSLDDMTNRDLFVAAAGCIRGHKHRGYQIQDVVEEKYDVSGYF